MKDPIERQDVIDELKKISFSHWFECGEYLSEDTRGIEIINSNKALEVIEALPSAQPERKTGKWERHNIYHGDDVSGYIDPDWRCSECGGQANVNAWCMYDLTDFCPHCGARLVQEGEDND